MKFDFKLNADAPGQHVAILVLAGVFMFLSLVEWIKGPSAEDLQGPEMRTPGESMYDNPQLTWYEEYFCRGYQRSFFCSPRLLHPFKSVFDSYGIHLEERAVDARTRGHRDCDDDATNGCFAASYTDDGDVSDPLSARGVVYYRGPLPKKRAFSRRMSLSDFD